MKLSRISVATAISFVAMIGAAFADVIYGPEFISDCGCDVTVITSGSSPGPPPAYTPPSLSSLPFTLLDLGTGATGSPSTINNPGGGITSISFSGGIFPTSGLYSGSFTNTFLSPFGGSNSISPTPTNNYLVAGEVGGTVTIDYATPQTALNLLWGTVDNNIDPSRNQVLTLMAGSTAITGADIFEAVSLAGGSLVNEQDDVGVEITGLSPFRQVQASDQNLIPAFEFVPAAVPAPPDVVPEPASVGILSVGLLGILVFARRKTRRLHG